MEKPLSRRFEVVSQYRAGRTYKERPDVYNCPNCGMIAFPMIIGSLNRDELPEDMQDEKIETLWVKPRYCISCLTN